MSTGYLKTLQSIALIIMSSSFGRGAVDPVDVAASQLGKPYAEPPDVPDSWDCSALTQYAYGQAGMTLPRTAAEQSTIGVVTTGLYQRGDLLFFSTDPALPGTVTHVGIYEGNSMMISAEWYNVGVHRASIAPGSWWGTRLLFAKRLIVSVNQPPTAGFVMSAQGKSATGSPGGQQTLNLSVPPGGSVSVSFDGSFPTYSKDDASVTAWQWKVDTAVVSSTPTFTKAFAIGTYNISLVVTDNQGLPSTAATGRIVVGVQPTTTYFDTTAYIPPGAVSSAFGLDANNYYAGASIVPSGTWDVNQIVVGLKSPDRQGSDVKLYVFTGPLGSAPIAVSTNAHVPSEFNGTNDYELKVFNFPSFTMTSGTEYKILLGLANLLTVPLPGIYMSVPYTGGAAHVYQTYLLDKDYTCVIFSGSPLCGAFAPPVDIIRPDLQGIYVAIQNQ